MAIKVPEKCRDLRVAELMPWWCRGVCMKTETKLCYWFCKPVGKSRAGGKTSTGEAK